MRFVNTAIRSTHALRQFVCREQASGLDYAPFAMHPVGFDRIEPRAFHWQQATDDPHAAVPFDVLIVVANPLSDGTTAMPRGVVPDQQPRRLAQRLQPLADPRQELGRDLADGTPLYEPQPNLLTFRPEHPVAGHRWWVWVCLGDLCLMEPQWWCVAPTLQGRQCHAAPPHFIDKAERPGGMAFREADQSVPVAFFWVY